MPTPSQQQTGDFGKKVLMTLFGVLLAYSIVLIGTMIRNNTQKFYFIGEQDHAPRTITVSGEGKVVAKPDVARTTMGAYALAPTTKEGLDKTNTIMKKLIDGLKALGVSEDDIKTENYSYNPHYNYTQTGGSQIDGYEVNQQITVKIRDVKKTDQILAIASTAGATNGTVPAFDIDEPKVYQEEARQKAIAEAFANAKTLANQLGVRIVRVVAYSEGGSPVYSPMYDMGMRTMDAKVESMPSIQPGSQEVIVNASLVFEIR